MRLDGSQEFWRYDANSARQYDNPMLAQDYLPAHSEPSMLEMGFHGAIAQAAWPSPSENEFLNAIKSESQFILATTGWIDLTANNALAAMSQYQGSLAGFRWWLDDSTLADNYSDLCRGINWLSDFDFSLDISLAGTNVNNALLRAGIALDHWRDLISDLAHQNNHWFKLTGLAEKVSAPDYEDQLLDVDIAAPFLDIMLEKLGSDRLIYASGWPNSNLYATIEEVYDITVALIEPLSADEQAAIMGDNAARCYRLT